MTARHELIVDSSGPVHPMPPLPSSPGHTVEAAALARLQDYMRHAPAADEHEAMIARGAYVSGFSAGARWGVRTAGALANPEFRQAIAVLADLVLHEAEP